MIKRILLALLILITPAIAHATVVLQPNSPCQASNSTACQTPGWLIYPNASRDIYVNISGGTLNTVNWTVLSGTATLDTTFGTAPYIKVTAGSTTGSCSISGTLPSTVTITSTTNFTIRATSIDDPTVHVDIPFAVCAQIGEVHIPNYYEQAYVNQPVIVSALMPYSHDKTGVWSITSNPGSHGSLTDTGFEDTVFSATTAGLYQLTFTPNVAGGTPSTSLVYVHGTIPSWYTNPPDTAPPFPCDANDTTTFTTIIDVGPTQSGGNSIQAYFNTGSPLSAGTMLRIHNEDTGTTPTTYHEYWQMNSGGTATHPITICGVPNSLGYLPIISGVDATGNSTTSVFAAFPFGLISVYANTFGYFPTAASPAYIQIKGLHAGFQYQNGAGPPAASAAFYPGNPAMTAISRNTGTGIVTITMASSLVSCFGFSQSFIKVTGVTGMSTDPNGYWTNTQCGGGNTITYAQAGPTESGSVSGAKVEFLWSFYGNGGSSAINLRNGGYVDVDSNHIDTVFIGVFSSGNSNRGWASIAQDTRIANNFIENYGDVTSLNHAVYLQGFHNIVEGNKAGAVNSGAIAAGFKLRGVYFKTRWNWIGPGPVRPLNMPENQDGNGYVDPPEYMGGGNYPTDTFGPNRLAGEEDNYHDDNLTYGNIINNGSSLTQLGPTCDHVPCGGGVYAVNNNRLTNTFYNNTVIDSQYLISNKTDGGPDVYAEAPNYYLANNELYSANSGNLFLQYDEQFIGTFQTNLFHNSPSITVNSSFAGGSNGWQIGCSYTCYMTSSNPVSAHQYGLTNPNFIQVASSPINASTFVPNSGGGADGAATTLVGEASHNPVRAFWDIPNHRTTLRTRITGATPTDIGAVDFNGTATAATPTFSPVAGSYGGTQTVTISTSSGGVICYNTTGSPATNGTTGCTTGTLYTTPVTVSASETLYAVAGGTGFLDSTVGSAAYTINGTGATPTFSPVAGSYSSTQNVTISSSSSGAVICYNTTGSPATNGSTGCTTGTLYTSPVVVSTSETLYAVAGGTAYLDSSVGSAAYTITAGAGGSVTSGNIKRTGNIVIK